MNLLVSGPANIRYLTGLDISAGIAMMQGGKTTLFVDGRYEEASHGSNVAHVENIKNLPKYVKKYKSIKFESEHVTIAQLKRWRKMFMGTRLVPSSGIIEKMRRVKRPDEVRNIKHACRITKRVLKSIPGILKFGITEKALAWKIESAAREYGADCMAFDLIVAFGGNTSHPHHKPSTRELGKGDIVQIDIGVKYNGYCSDFSRVFFTSKPTAEQERVFNLLCQTEKCAIKKARAGTFNTALDEFARSKLERAGYAENLLHSLGHGVGLEVHETPTVSVKAKKTRLVEGDAIAIEPGIYFAGKWGMRIEDTIIVTT